MDENQSIAEAPPIETDPTPLECAATLLLVGAIDICLDNVVLIGAIDPAYEAELKEGATAIQAKAQADGWSGQDMRWQLIQWLRHVNARTAFDASLN